MQNRDTSLANPQDVLNDAVTHRPSVAQSMWQNFSLGFATAPFALNSFNAEYMQSPHGQHVAATFDALKVGNRNAEVGWVQWGANEAANLVGQSLNPITWIFGEAGGLAMKPVTSLVSKVAPNAVSALARKPITELMSENAAKYIPKYIGNEGQEKTLSMALFGKKWAEGFGIGAGAMLPQATVDAFNAETGVHDIKDMAVSAGMGGVFGLGIATIPFAWGIAKANINRARGKPAASSLTATDAEAALNDGLIDKETHDLWKAGEQYKSDPEFRVNNEPWLKENAAEYLDRKGHKVDRAQDKAQFEVLSSDQMQNFQSATVDHLVSDFIPEEQRGRLTDFTVHAGLDETRNRPEIFDGVRGYVEYANDRLAKRDEILVHADRLVDEHLAMNHVDLPMSQKEIYSAIKEHGQENIPSFTVPEEVRAKIKNDMFELKEPIEELKDIKLKLFEDNKLKDNYKIKPEYYRLQDLGEIWHPARTLLDRIHLEEDLNRQAAYRDFAKQMLGIADNNLGKLANVDQAKDYFEARTKSYVNEVHEPKVSEQEMAKQHEVPADAETIIAEQDRIVEKHGNEYVKKEYEHAKEKFDEFKKSEGIFKNLINCILGAQ